MLNKIKEKKAKKIKWRIKLAIKNDESYMGIEDEEIERQHFILDYYFLNHNCYKEHRGTYVTNDKLTEDECHEILENFAKDFPELVVEKMAACSISEYTPEIDLTYFIHLPDKLRIKEMKRVEKLDREGVQDEEIFSKENLKQYDKYIPKSVKKYLREQDREQRKWMKKSKNEEE